MKVVVRVRSGIGMKPDIRKTLESISLKSVNNCTVINEKKVHKKMLQVAKDYITWGDVEKETLHKLLTKWARTENGRKLDEAHLNERKTTVESVVERLTKDETTLKAEGIKPTIRLHPPRRGYEGVKRPYTMKGALGNRGKDMDKLVSRMI